MQIPALKGIIRRRILLNYRVSPATVAPLLPHPFRPKIYRGYSIAGVCLIRLEQIRLCGLPAFTGISSENAAHRIAVEWKDDSGQARDGVFVPRRDTDSRLNAFAGGRLFPGVHHHSVFEVRDVGGEISIRITAKGLKNPLVETKATETSDFPEASIFDSLADSSAFFESGCIGYSARPDSGTLDGLLLKVPEWRVSPLSVDLASSAYFDDVTIFPKERIQFDHALLMRDTPHEWHAEPEMRVRSTP